jgi:hypothetical protein
MIDVADILPPKDRPVPCLFAGQALIDKPRIKLATVGVEPDFAGRCCICGRPIECKTNFDFMECS